MFLCFLFFFFNDTAPTEIYPLPLHDALPIFSAASRSSIRSISRRNGAIRKTTCVITSISMGWPIFPAASPSARSSSHGRSEEHTSELQSQSNLVCRLLLEKKNTTPHTHATAH